MDSERLGKEQISTVELLARRGHILDGISNGLSNRCELKDHFAESRSTVYRGLDQLVSSGLVNVEMGKYHTTPLGEKLINEHNNYVETVSKIEDISELLEYLPNDLDIGNNLLVNTNISFPNKMNPQELHEKFCIQIQKSTHIKCLFPFLLPQIVELLRERMVKFGSNIEVISETKFFEYYKENKNLLDLSDIPTLEVSLDIPFGLVITEQPTPSAMIMVYGDTGELRGLIINETEVAFTWGHRIYQSYLDKATKIII